MKKQMKSELSISSIMTAIRTAQNRKKMEGLDQMEEQYVEILRTRFSSSSSNNSSRQFYEILLNYPLLN